MQSTGEPPKSLEATSRRPYTSRKLRILLVFTLVILAAQAWFGDFVNVFVSTGASTPPPYSLGGFVSEVASQNSFPLYWHAFEGLFLFALGIAVLALSFKWSRSKGVRIASILGLFSIFAAGLGGMLFVLSGFSNGGNSMQMGGSFVAAFGLYFVALFYAK